MTNNSTILSFLAIFLADFAVRTAYMTGKSPVLQVFAGELGANEILLGSIVAISASTGLVLKPVFGILSDHHGQWIWLLLGTVIFAFTPILYLEVSTTDQLITLRLFHGLATAIYGPVTLAFISNLDDRPNAEMFGWFGLSRTTSYVIGPIIGGFLLSVFSPAAVYLCTSFIAVIAFIPVMTLRKRTIFVSNNINTSKISMIDSVKFLLKDTSLIAFGFVEMSSRIGIYAVKTFMPLIILANGGSPLDAGIFLSIQELAAAMARPIAGRIADRAGMASKIAIFGIIIVATSLSIIPLVDSTHDLSIVAILIGVGQGVYQPVLLYMISNSTANSNQGLAFGCVGAIRNLGKLLGPLIGGTLLFYFSLQLSFFILSLVTLLSVIPLKYCTDTPSRYLRSTFGS